MSASTNPNTNTNTPSNATSIGTKVKGSVKVAKGMSDTVRGTTMAAMEAVEHRDGTAHEELVRRGRMEIEEGISMIRGHPMQNQGQGMNGPNDSLQGWGSGINGGNADATTNTTGFPPPRGQEYAQNSTTANMHSDLGRGSNAYSGAGNTASQPSQYPNPGAAYPPDGKNAGPGGMGYTHPTQMGNRPVDTTAPGGMVGQDGYNARRDADQI